MGALTALWAAGATWKFWLKAAPWLALAASLALLWAVWGWWDAADARADKAEAMLDQAIQINNENAAEAERVAKQAAADRAAVLAELDRAKARAAQIAQIKKDQRNAPDAAEPVSPYDADFFDRVRATRDPG